jgi:hypothetical protein
VWFKWGSEWSILERGIDPCDYTMFDSDAGIRSDPSLKWQPRGTQFELWPIPATNNLTVRFFAKRPFTPLVDEADICDLDTDLIVLHAAAELARKYSEGDAPMLLARATQHYATLKTRNTRGARAVNFAAGGAPRQRYSRFDFAPVGGGGGASSAATPDNVSVSLFVAGLPSAGELLLLQSAARAFTASLALSSAAADVAAAAQAVFTITLDGAPFATVTFAAGQSEGVFAFSGTSVPEDGVLRFIAPASADATLSDISISLGGTAV